MCKDENVRIVIKQGSGVPTVPVSADHRNGDWLTTDIYEGEQYQDTDTGIVYTRSATGIESVGGGGGAIQPRIWEAQMSQVGTSAPVLDVLVNTLGVTAVPSYVGVGTFLISGFDSNLTGNTAVECPANNTLGYMSKSIASSSSINLYTSTHSAGVFSLANDVLSTAQKITQIIRVTKYD